MTLYNLTKQVGSVLVTRNGNWSLRGTEVTLPTIFTVAFVFLYYFVTSMPTHFKFYEFTTSYYLAFQK